ncbi:hypothetical protein RAD15_02415 [Bradyrhizobium sp. 14AA]
MAVLYQTTTTAANIFAARPNWPGSFPEIVATSTYDVTSPTVDSQVVALASTSANVFLNASTGKFTSQAIRKAAQPV